MQQPLTSVQLSDARPANAPQLPPRPRNIEETGLSLSYIADMMLRALYLIGEMSGQQLVDLLHLPYGVVVALVVAAALAGFAGAERLERQIGRAHV